LKGYQLITELNMEGISLLGWARRPVLHVACLLMMRFLADHAQADPGIDRVHIMIVSDRKSTDGTPYMIHNIGAGTQEEDRLFEFAITGHYRVKF
jgi:hypothetical protein